MIEHPPIRRVGFWISDSASPRWDFLSDRLHLDTLVAKIGCRLHGHEPFTDMDGITVYCAWNCGKVFPARATGSSS